jgi:glutaryl-CoA dehydrogenase
MKFEIPRTLFEPEHEAFRATVRAFIEKEVLPEYAEWEEAGYTPREIWRRAGEVGLLGTSIPEAYGGFGGDFRYDAVVLEELGRYGLGAPAWHMHSYIIAPFITSFGTEEQKREWLPRMAAGEAIGCFGLTEPDAGSDPGSMRTRARRDGDDWVLNGAKMWITNGSVADVAVVWAQTDEGVRGFLVPAGTAGFATQDIHQKLSLRASVTSELILDDVRLPAAAQLPEAAGLRAPLSCLSEARFCIVFGAVGAARACYEAALDYSVTREQFGKPIAAFQLTQAKLAQMLLKVNQGTLLALHLGRMKDGGTLRPEHVSFGKLANVNAALEVAREARQVLGANGITLEYPVIRHMNNLESVVTYEGTADVHTLVLGQAITGQAAYR